MKPIILGEKEVSRRGAVVTVKRYVKGWHPELGQLHWGLTGPETVVDVTLIQTLRIFVVSSGIQREAA